MRVRPSPFAFRFAERPGSPRRHDCGYNPAVAPQDRQDRDGETAPWYADGLRFECQADCGRCCTNHGKYAYVYLEGKDPARLAGFFEMSEIEFRERYTTLEDGYVVLTMGSPSCPFLDGTRCTVYEARPAQCRTFPFWDEQLSTKRVWDRTEEFCPGINLGQLHSLATIRQRLAERESD